MIVLSASVSRMCVRLFAAIRLLHRYWVIQHVFAQQWQMYHDNTRRCDDRIVSISQPYVRPIVRGKLNKPVEFGSKLSVSLTGEGLARVDHLSWDAFHEGLECSSVDSRSYLVRTYLQSECVADIALVAAPSNGSAHADSLL